VLIPVIAIPLSLVGTFTLLLALGLDQPADIAGAGAGDRARGRRCHHRGRERQPPSRRGYEAGSGRDQGRARSPADRGHDIVLIAVYVPIGFQSGLTGALFTEFAFTLAGAVTVSR